MRVCDYADLNVPMLSRMFDRRCQGYEAVGSTIPFQPARFPGGPWTPPFPWTPNGRKITRRVCSD
jgi:hypothetical protein